MHGGQGGENAQLLLAGRALGLRRQAHLHRALEGREAELEVKPPEGPAIGGVKLDCRQLGPLLGAHGCTWGRCRRRLCSVPSAAGALHRAAGANKVQHSPI